MEIHCMCVLYRSCWQPMAGFFPVMDAEDQLVLSAELEEPLSLPLPCSLTPCGLLLISSDTGPTSRVLLQTGTITC